MTTNAGCVIKKSDEASGFGFTVEFDVRAEKGVCLPHFICVFFGEGEPMFVIGLGIGFEKIVLVDDSSEGVGGNFGSRKVTLFDTDSIDEGDGWISVLTNFGLNLLDGVQDIFDTDFACFAFVASGFVVHDGDTVLFESGVPSLDGAPSELARASILVGERHLADGVDTGDDGFSGCRFDGAQDA